MVKGVALLINLGYNRIATTKGGTKLTDPRAGTVPLPYLRAWRERKLLTRAALAEKSGVTESAIAKIEGGHVAGVQFNTIHKLADALGITADQLISTQP